MKTKMIVKVVIFGITILFVNNVCAQNETEKPKRERVLYTLFYNVVPDNFKYPLIGFVNRAKGNHKTVQIGFLNTTLKNFSGLQAGFVNATRRKVNGMQAGFVNATPDSLSGVQIGFVNTALKDMKGFQAGFVNIAKKARGSQIGLVNIADSISGGIPIAFLSFVRKGAYRAIEVSANELYPVNLTFKIGIPKFYTFIQGNYNPNYSKQFASTLGFGSLFKMGNTFYFNPETGVLVQYGGNDGSFTMNLAANFRYNLNSRLQLTAGPSLTWLNYHQGQRTFDKPFLTLSDKELDSQNRLLIGFRFGLSYNLTKLN